MRTFIALATALAVAAPAAAQDIKLPSAITATAYDTGSSGFNIAVAVGKALKDKHGTDLRVLPAGNDVARLAPLRAGRAQISAMGIGIYYAQEAVYEFAVKDWGPQPLQLLLSSTDCNGAALGVAKDSGVTTPRELKGKRLGWVVGSPALNLNAVAVLAFGGLTLADVKVVEFSSFGAKWKGMVNNEIDAAWASTISGQAKEVETSPRGLRWLAVPHADKEGWARMLKVGSYFSPHIATCGAGLSPQAPLEGATYPYPIFMAYASQPADLVYAISKAMIVHYDQYKDGAPGAAGLSLATQNLKWVVPYHPGTVRALKEAGIWKSEHDQHNSALIKRQQTLAAAWQAYLKTNPPDDREAFRKGWMTARKQALVGAGLEPLFD